MSGNLPWLQQLTEHLAEHGSTCVYCDVPALHSLKIESGTLLDKSRYLSLCEYHYLALRTALVAEGNVDGV